MRADQVIAEAEHLERGQTDCVHYWCIDPPMGAVSRGVCRICGEEREFKNFLEYDALFRDSSSQAASEAREQHGQQSPRFF